MGKSTIDGLFSMALLNNQMVSMALGVLPLDSSWIVLCHGGNARGSPAASWSPLGLLFSQQLQMFLQCGAPKLAKLFITPITMVYGTYNYSYWGL